MFCPPLGRFTSAHLHMIQSAGFAGLRTVELLSMDLPRQIHGLRLMPTTLQAHNHGRLAYTRNIVRRLAIRNLWPQIMGRNSSDWSQLARSLAEVVNKRGGVFHLWGHSWEVQQNGQWERLEEVLRMLSAITDAKSRLSNSALCGCDPAGVRSDAKSVRLYPGA
jgi:hypothetical protein